jgi:hypothetical protein
MRKCIVAQYKSVEMCPETQWELRWGSGLVRSTHSSHAQLETAWKHYKQHFPNEVLYPYKVVLTRLAMVEQ